VCFIRGSLFELQRIDVLAIVLKTATEDKCRYIRVMSIDLEHLREWIGRAERSHDIVTAAPIAALSATLDRDDPSPRQGDRLPALWHWLYFLPTHRQSELGADGHVRLGGFLPPVTLPRRLYGGGRVEILHRLLVGDPIQRVSRILDVSTKDGRTGPLVFVRVGHEISSRERLALREEHDIVYRDAFKPDDPPPPLRRAPDGAAWAREIHPDDVLLFRYSALTFNGYRIHYDRRFATEAQGHPGLVVHAPLVATLLADLLRRNLPEANVSSFSFRAITALFDTGPFFLCGRPDGAGSVKLWARGPAGALAVEATARLGSN
jgi:3-methylfumaryl-CoA hydratase